MVKDVIITAFKNVTNKGVTLELNKKTSLKTGYLKSKEFFVSWDKIGLCLFENYTDTCSVDELNKLRK